MPPEGRTDGPVAVSGASGLVGAALCRALSAAGRRVLRLVRGDASGPCDVAWDPAAGSLDEAALAGAASVVHLAGAPISVRWSAAAKARIRDSRVHGTRAIAEGLARLESPPEVLVCASAIGYYGDVDDDLVRDETAPPGGGFLGETAQAWEAACEPARAAGIRVVHLRFGVVLSPAGGALAAMLPAFRLGLGGPVGSGRQWMSWVALDDAVRVIRRAIDDPTLEGPLNVVAPAPVRQAEFAKTLGRVLGRPALLPLPGFAVRALFGDMGEALLLKGARVEPAALQRAGFCFEHPRLGDALGALLGQP